MKININTTKERRGTTTPFTLCNNLLVPVGIQLLQYLMTAGSVVDILLTWRPRSCLQASHFPQLGGKVTPSWVSSPGLPSGNHTRCLWPTEKRETITGGVAHSLLSSTILSQGERNKSWQWDYLHPVVWGDNVTPNYCCYLPFQKLQMTNFFDECPLNLSWLFYLKSFPPSF